MHHGALGRCIAGVLGYSVYEVSLRFTQLTQNCQLPSLTRPSLMPGKNNFIDEARRRNEPGTEGRSTLSSGRPQERPGCGASLQCISAHSASTCMTSASLARTVVLQGRGLWCLELRLNCSDETRRMNGPGRKAAKHEELVKEQRLASVPVE